jgi:hypothetical protein
MVPNEKIVVANMLGIQELVVAKELLKENRCMFSSWNRETKKINQEAREAQNPFESNAHVEENLYWYSK